jgi:uncharacterized alkaline shock family protein YloU
MNIIQSFIFVCGLFCFVLTRSALGQTAPTTQLGKSSRGSDLFTQAAASVVSSGSARSRAIIIEDYNTNFLGALVSLAELNWTGSVSGCAPGGISVLAQNRTLQRINFYRRLVGVSDNITLDPSRNAVTQEAALLIKANNSVNHYPPSSWLCYTATGNTGLANSNLAIGNHSAQTVKQFIDDAGAGNEVIGHRRWLLYPKQASFGIGATDVSCAIWVMNNFVTPPTSPAYVAFPSAGYVPRDLISGRWSFSIPDADFSAATITMTDEAGLTISRTQYPVTNGYGDNTLVWDLTNPGTDLAWNGSTDKAFTVRVAGVKIGSVVQPDYVYRVVAIDPTTPTLTLTTINPTCGASLNNGNITANFDRGAKSYLWNTGATTQTISNLGPGSYTVTVTDKNDCTYTESVTLSNITANVPAIKTSASVACAGNVLSLSATNCAGVLSWSDGLGTGAVKTIAPAITTTYSVTCAESACISTTASATISVSGPLPASCSVVATRGLSTYYGVERFVLNTIDAGSSSSYNDGANYMNRACDYNTVVTAGTSYSVLVKGYFTNSHRLRVYIDYNNNGLFTDAGETVLTGTGNSFSATVSIPTTAVQNVPLRVRVVADPASTLSSCLLPGASTFGSGQAEDYSLTIAPVGGYPPPTIPVLTASTTLVCAGSMVSLSATNCNGVVNWSGGLGNGTTKSVMPLVTTTYSVSCVQTGNISTTASVVVSVNGSGPGMALCSVSAMNGSSSVFGIERVVFNTIDMNSSSTADAGANYINRACAVSTTVTAGQSYSVLVKGNGTATHQSLVCIDYNNNGVFTDPGEIVLTGVGNSVTATVPIPVTAVTNTLLRIRVVADAASASGMSACLLPGASGSGSGQAEDFALRILAMAVPPPTIPVLTASSTSVCVGSVVSLSATNCNGVVNWSGGLGNGTTKSVIPMVTTTYSVSCVQTGYTSTTASVAVFVRPGPMAALCSVSATNGPSSSFGIERVVFNTINLSSSAATDGGANYINRACDASTSVTAGSSYSVLIKGYGSTSHESRVYIDYNNNGVFTDPGETVLTGAGNSVTATVVISTSAVQNTLLRMRVVADGSANVSPCLLPGVFDLGSGQAEDFCIVVLATPISVSVTPPTIPVLTASTTLVCAGSMVSLSATNCNGVVNWSGGLGNGTTKSVMPLVTTTYGVSCVETGNISTTASATVVVAGPLPAQCSLSATNGLSQYFGVEVFTFNTINLTSGTSGMANEGNYVNRVCDYSTTVTAGTSYTALVKGAFSYTHRCRLYIDFNNNGLFTDPGELVLTGTGNAIRATVPIPTTAVQNTALRMRVIADPSANVSPCLLPGTSLGSGQAEDYALTIIPAPVLITIPVLTASASAVCTGDIVSLTVTNCNGVVNWSGGLGNGITKSVMPTVTATYSVSCVQTGNVSTTVSVTVQVRPIPRPALCNVVASLGVSQFFGIERFVFNTIAFSSSTSAATNEGSYVNRVCETSTTVTAGLSYTISVKGTFGYTHRCRVYIDYNNNGVFTDPGETVLSGTTMNNSCIATVVIPTTTVQNIPLRVRVVADPSANLSSCLLPGVSGFGSGQAEDYSVTILPVGQIVLRP